MATLGEYASEQFPGHRIEGRGQQAALRAHTTVMRVMGARRTGELEQQLRGRYPGDGTIASVVIRPEGSTMTPTSGEDPEGIADVPAKRPLAALAATGVVAGLAAGLIVGFVAGNATIGVIVGIFVALLAGWIGGLVGGGGRFAGQRAWEQVRTPDTTVGLIAVLADDERRALDAAAEMDSLGALDVRILDDHGAWHVPNTFVTGIDAAETQDAQRDERS